MKWLRVIYPNQRRNVLSWRAARGYAVRLLYRNVRIGSFDFVLRLRLRDSCGRFCLSVHVSFKSLSRTFLDCEIDLGGLFIFFKSVGSIPNSILKHLEKYQRVENPQAIAISETDMSLSVSIR